MDSTDPAEQRLSIVDLSKRRVFELYKQLCNEDDPVNSTNIQFSNLLEEYHRENNITMVNKQSVETNETSSDAPLNKSIDYIKYMKYFLSESDSSVSKEASNAINKHLDALRQTDNIGSPLRLCPSNIHVQSPESVDEYQQWKNNLENPTLGNDGLNNKSSTFISNVAEQISYCNDPGEIVTPDCTITLKSTEECQALNKNIKETSADCIIIDSEDDSIDKILDMNSLNISRTEDDNVFVSDVSIPKPQTKKTKLPVKNIKPVKRRRLKLNEQYLIDDLEQQDKVIKLLCRALNVAIKAKQRKFKRYKKFTRLQKNNIVKTIKKQLTLHKQIKNHI